jgi:hypothetical protein
MKIKIRTKSIVIRFDDWSTRCQVMLINEYMNESNELNRIESACFASHYETKHLNKNKNTNTDTNININD